MGGLFDFFKDSEEGDYLRYGRDALDTIFGAPKRAIDYLATKSYKSDPVWDEQQQRMVLKDRPGLENLETMPVEEMAVNAIAPKPLPGDPQVPTPYQNIANAGRGVLRAGTRFGMDPLSYGMNIPGIAGKAVAGYFGVEGTRGAIEKGQEALNAENVTEGIEPAIEALVSGGMGALGLKHAASRGRTVTTPETPKFDEVNDIAQGPFNVPDQLRAGKPITEIGDLVLDPNEVGARRFENMTDEYVNQIKAHAAEALQNPEINNIGVEYRPNSGDILYDQKNNRIVIDPVAIRSVPPEEIARTLLHEVAHTAGLHEFPGVAPETPGNIPISPELAGGRGYTPIGEGKFAEVDPALSYHQSTTKEQGFEADPINQRAKVSPEEHNFQTAWESLQNHPEIGNVSRRYSQNLERLFAERNNEIVNESMPGAGDVLPVPPLATSSGKGPADIFKQVLEEAKLTTFNKNTILSELEARGIPIPESMKGAIPDLLSELKTRGLANERPGGKYTLNIQAPKNLKTAKGPSEPVSDLESQLKASLKTSEPVKTNVPEISSEPRPSDIKTEKVTEPGEKPAPKTLQPKGTKTKLSHEELVNLGIKFAGKVRNTVPDEVRMAEEAAKKGGGKKPPKEPKPPKEDFGGEDGGEERPTNKSFKVTLSDGSEHNVKAPSADEAKVAATKILETGGSTKTVDKVAEKLSSLQEAAKEETSSFKTGTEKSAEDILFEKESQKAERTQEISSIKQKQQLEKAQTKEKLTKKSFSVKLSDGTVHNVRARNPERARQFVEDKIRSSKSDLKVTEVTAKKSKLEQSIDQSVGKAQATAVEKLQKGLIDDVTDIPKTMKSAFDISWPGRQGLFLLNRPSALKGMVEGTKAGIPFKGKEIHEAIQKDLSTRPNAQLYKDSGLNQISWEPTDISQRSEQFASERASNLPGLRHSERAFNDAGNLARANMFDEFATRWKSEGKTFETHPDLYKGLGDYLNVLTMRKPLPEKLRQAGWILNKMFFSPMAVYSRMELLNPKFYLDLPKELRGAAARDIGGTLATIGSMLGMVKFAANQAGIDKDDVDVSFDPANTNFGRLKVKETYYDMTGLTPMVRTLYRITSGRMSTPKGDYKLPGGIGSRFQKNLKDAPFGRNAWDEGMGFFENKTSPLYQVGKGIGTGKGWYGKEYGFADALADTFLPMSPESMIEAGNEFGPGAAARQLPNFFGVGTTTPPGPESGSSSSTTHKKKRKVSAF